jgi:hypothetical protein
MYLKTTPPSGKNGGRRSSISCSSFSVRKKTERKHFRLDLVFLKLIDIQRNAGCVSTTNSAHVLLLLISTYTYRVLWLSRGNSDFYAKGMDFLHETVKYSMHSIDPINVDNTYRGEICWFVRI